MSRGVLQCIAVRIHEAFSRLLHSDALTDWAKRERERERERERVKVT